MRRSLVSLLAVYAVTACGDSVTEPARELGVVATADGLQLTNDTGEDLFYQAVDAETLALWAGPSAVTRCEGPDCPHVPPDETVVVTWDEVLGWSETTSRVTVYWWRVVPDTNGGWRVSGEVTRSQSVDVP